MRYCVLFLFLLVTPCFAQTTTGSATAKGPCASAVTGSNNTIHCEVLESKPSETTGPPFAFTVEVKIVSPGQGNFTGFWLKYSEERSCTIWPIDDLLFLRVTNMDSNPKTIVDYSLETNMKGEWVPVRRIPLASGSMITTLTVPGQELAVGRTLNFPSNGAANMYPLMSLTASTYSLKHAGIVEFPAFDELIGTQPLFHEQTVRGWAGFHWDGLLDGPLRIKITDELGKIYTVEPQTTKERGPRDEDISPHVIKFTSLYDASSCVPKFNF